MPENVTFQSSKAPAADTPAPTVNAAAPASPAPAKEEDITKGAQERPEHTKVNLTGDRLRRYYPDVSMTPREIEEDIYSKLEFCRQRDEMNKQKEALFKKPGHSR